MTTHSQDSSGETNSKVNGGGGQGGDDRNPRIMAERALKQFLARHDAVQGTIDPKSVTDADLMPAEFARPQCSSFAAKYDTLLYSQLIDKLLKHVFPGQVRTLLDLGAGSSIPTLRALLTHPLHEDIHVTAVDCDLDALAVSTQNVTLYGLEDRYSFQQGDILRYLSDLRVPPESAIVSNPPFLPVADDVTDPRYTPADGGVDGTKYLAAMLKHPMPVGTHVVLEWSSLSHP